MNYLELQQRANILVNKVNEYESNLTGQTIDESEILEQHLYADIFSLRPVMKMLFGKNLTEKLNRTLENDVDLKVYALNSPMNRTSFSLLSSYNPYPLTTKVRDLITPVGSISVNLDGWTTRSQANSGYFTANPSDFLPDQNQPVEYRKLKLYFKCISSYVSTFPIIAVDSDNRTNGIVSTSYRNGYYFIPEQYSMQGSGYQSNQAIGASVGNEILVEILIKPYTAVETDKNNGCYYYMEYTVTNLSTEQSIQSVSPYYMTSLVGNSNPGYLPIKEIRLGANSFTTPDAWSFNVEKSTVEIYKTSFEEGYTQEVVHDNVISLDTYNNHNMLIQDAYVNTVVDRDTRIKAGINYSYSSNIQDALVTESQVANLFKWNTTTSLDIANNSMSINRQVPGIVVYYLGTDYDSTYTATIPYNPGSIKLNQINYSTPPYYGAYYMTDETQSQIGLQMGAEACRIFMPGLNYTRGQLESPQQIWQPDRLVGTANVGLGYNWQGGSVYHELVFKNRRQGSQDAGVDFISPVESDIDNDPQGLALRTALAQQKPYYYNRLWFSELDELYGANMEKLAGAIGSYSWNETYLSLNTDILETTTDNLTFNPDGNVSGFTNNDYIDFKEPNQYANQNTGTTWILEFTTGNEVVSIVDGFFDANNYLSLFIQQGALRTNTFDRLVFNVEPNTTYRLKIVTTAKSTYSFQPYNLKTDEYQETFSFSYSFSSSHSYITLGSTLATGVRSCFSGKINLVNSSVQLPEQEPITFGEVVDETKTFESDEEYFNVLKLDYDTWAQALDKPL